MTAALALGVIWSCWALLALLAGSTDRGWAWKLLLATVTLGSSCAGLVVQAL